MIAALLAQAAAIAATPAVVVEGAWARGCDNTGACAAVPLENTRAPLLMVRLERDAGGALRLTVPLGSTAGTRYTLAVDGKPVATLVAPGGGGGLGLPLDAALRTKLTAGKSLTLLGAAGKTVSAASLQGFDRVLRGLDTAPAAITATIAQPPAEPRPPARFETKQARRLLQREPCVGPRTFRVDATHTLALVTPCGGQASALIVDEKGRASVAPLDGASGGALVWDPATRRLRSDSPASGAVCARQLSYAWDGTAFRLADRVETPCRAGGAPLVTWRATVSG